MLPAQEALLQSYDDNIQTDHQMAYFTQQSRQSQSRCRGCGRGSSQGGRYQGRGQGQVTHTELNRGGLITGLSTCQRPMCQICGLRGYITLKCLYRFDETYKKED